MPRSRSLKSTSDGASLSTHAPGRYDMAQQRTKAIANVYDEAESAGLSPRKANMETMLGNRARTKAGDDRYDPPKKRGRRDYLVTGRPASR